MEEVKWSSRSSFVLASIGSAIGLGNVWRFPYITYKFGGGAFIVAYIISLMLIGIPLLILEYSLGFKFKGSAPIVFNRFSRDKNLALNFEWLGWFAVLVGFGIVTYYAVVMGWAFDYFLYSFTLAWGDNPSDFFYNKVLKLTNHIFDFGEISWMVVLGLFACWVWTLLSIWKGVKTLGKVIYVIVILPWILLAMFVIRGITLPGALKGIDFYLTPKWDELLNPALWHAAISQVFYSLTVGFGVMIAYASFLPEGSDLVNSAIIVALSDSATAFVAGFAVFSTLGYYSHLQGVSVAEVMKSGPELAFVTYPTIISKLPLGPVWGVLFFLMLLNLSVSSALSLVKAFVAALIDKFGVKRSFAKIGIGLTAFLIGILYTTGAGLYWLDVVDYFMNHFGLFAVVFIQSVLVGWIYGAEDLRQFANSVSDRPIGKWWNLSVKFIVPLTALVIFVLSLRDRIREPYGGYPRVAEVLGGWALLGFFLVLSIYLTTRKTKRSD